MYRILLMSLLLVLTAASCEFKAEIKNQGNTEAGKKNSKIRNGIIIKENKLKVDQAFLIYEEDGSLVPESNEVSVGKQLILRLIIDTGFTVIDGKAFPGASEKVQTSDGKTLLDEPDLFSSYSAGVSPKDAGIVSLYAKITSIDKLYDYFLVSFRIWDKKGTGDVTGSYKFHIK